MEETNRTVFFSPWGSIFLYEIRHVVLSGILPVKCTETYVEDCRAVGVTCRSPSTDCRVPECRVPIADCPSARLPDCRSPIADRRVPIAEPSEPDPRTGAQQESRAGHTSDRYATQPLVERHAGTRSEFDMWRILRLSSYEHVSRISVSHGKGVSDRTERIFRDHGMEPSGRRAFAETRSS